MSTPSLKLTNTLTRQKEDFVPIDAANVRMYVCGPTVYDFAHIGNARPVIVFDVLFRLLRHVYGDDHVTYVRNITDVDDKINARALRDFPNLPLNDAIRRVTETTATQFATDVAALGCLPPSVEPRATEHIGGMITIIERLIAKGHAYDAGGEVLFRVASMADYGQLSGRNLEDNIAGARVAVDSQKENPADFVLWKASSDEEPGWDSPWGRGRPGWHIECSAMSEAFLGETFDIHGGGLDLIFPHHENEIAQSRCAHGTDVMAKYWMHNGYLQVEGRKMSKSEGNFVTIHDLLETEKFGGRTWPGEVLRLAMLMTHYREPIDFSVARLEEAEAKLVGWQRAAQIEEGTAPDASTLAELADDLNFSRASTVLDAMARKANRGEVSAAHCLAATLAFFGFSVDGLLKSSGDDESAIAAKVAARLIALSNKDFAKADALRAELADAGVALLDYKDPETGAKNTRWERKR
ncbi:cysteine--tRNA ligase [Pelagibacterium luteolum]|uniref:Cysteine--tRNA ligase n=1 Tax=Pelagibacterium luteolum TaxID=440168 RepID=A0A1G7TFI1_9HYPH|nr:cysteine--tRNA ligase [Pelagibacterium luteolum]SDG33862.1 cysteinyl-tRNA synthetase [Pelagibacterium luteolum]